MWSDTSNNEQGFTIERALSSRFTNGRTQFQVGAGVTTYTDYPLDPLKRYYYRVQAFNSLGPSPWSNTATVVTSGQFPAAPTNLRTSNATNSSIRLSWSDRASNETGYDVFMSSTGPNGPWQQTTLTGADIKTYTATGLLPNTTYYFQVRAYNVYGVSGYSNIASATTRP